MFHNFVVLGASHWSFRVQNHPQDKDLCTLLSELQRIGSQCDFKWISNAEHRVFWSFRGRGIYVLVTMYRRSTILRWSYKNKTLTRERAE